MSGHKGTTIRVSDENGLFRYFESIERGAIPTMRNIDGHANFVHARNDRNAEVT
jgi:hypothetical protein